MPNRKLRRRRPDQPRRIAYQVLRAVSSEGAYANLELGRALDGAGLEARDAAFVTELVAGTSRLAGTYDRILAAASGRPSFEPALADALRLGAHQLLSMRVPVHAAVGATVDLAAAEVGEKVAGLTNAVLRKVAARDLDGWIAELSRGEDDLGALALRTHHPRWIAEAYRDLLGQEAEAALAANNVAPVTTLVTRPGLAERDELGGEPTPFSPWGARRAGNPPTCPPCGRAAPASRTRAASSSSPRSPRRRLRPARGSTSAPGPAARRRCWQGWPSPRAPVCWPRSGSRTAPSWSPPHSRATPAPWPPPSSPPTAPVRRGPPAPSPA